MTSFALRCIAAAAMLIDHIGYAFYDVLPHPLLFRMVGRLSFPIFCFLITEGLYHTRDIRKYLLRLGIFAVISEVPFDWMLSQGRALVGWESQNVYWTLLLGLLSIVLFDTFAAQNRRLLSLISVLAAAAGAWLLRADYGAVGVYLIFVFYRFRGQPGPRAVFFSVGVLLGACLALNPDALMLLLAGEIDAGTFWEFSSWALVSLLQVAALPLIHAYNGAPGPRSKALQWSFYAFYPAHLLVLTLFRLALP